MKHLFLSLLAVSSTAAIVACVGDTPGAATPGPEMADAASSSSSSSSSGDVDSSTPVTCNAPETACANTCVNVATAEAHCGRCNHACGGGGCAAGVCQPMVVRAALPSNARIAPNAESVFYTAGPKILSVPGAGTALMPTQLADFTGYPTGALIALTKTGILFQASPNQATQRYGVYGCSQTGCAATPAALGGISMNGFDGLAVWDNDSGTSEAYFTTLRTVKHSTCNGDGSCTTATDLGEIPTGLGGLGSMIAADNDYVVFASSGTTAPSVPQKLYQCPKAGCTTPPTELVAMLPTINKVVIANNRVYLVLPGRDGYGEGRVRACTTTACTATATDITGPRGRITSFDIDATEMFFIDSDTKTVKRCLAEGCAAGAMIVATSTFPLEDVHIAGGFVYWLEKKDGSNYDLKRVARP